MPSLVQGHEALLGWCPRLSESLISTYEDQILPFEADFSVVVVV